MMNEQQIEKLCQVMQANGLGGMLICPSPLLALLTGHTPGICERFQGLFLCASGNRFYVCNKLYQDEIVEAVKGLKVYAWEDGESMSTVVEVALREYSLLGVPIAVNNTAQAVHILEIAAQTGAIFVNGTKAMDEARILKSQDELNLLRKAAHIADQAFLAVLPFIHPGMTEGEIRSFLFEQMCASGGTTCWGIVASGPNAGFPHYYGSQRKIKEKDVVLLDFGCSYHGLFSDISRTVFIGDATLEERQIYKVVQSAQGAAEAAVAVGAYIPDVDAAARDIICGAGYGSRFFNRLGHGIGYLLHEEPYIQKDNRRTLKPGMVFSIEPGIYQPGKLGVRIEDIVAVTPAGPEILNHATKELLIL